jgi:hypothetical protein
VLSSSVAGGAGVVWAWAAPPIASSRPRLAPPQNRRARKEPDDFRICLPSQGLLVLFMTPVSLFPHVAIAFHFSQDESAGISRPKTLYESRFRRNTRMWRLMRFTVVYFR